MRRFDGSRNGRIADFASLGQPNAHHTNEFAFLALKPPFDALRNLLGIVLVPPEMKGRPGFTCTPVSTFELPRFLRYGTTTQFGMCYPDLLGPVHTYTLFLAIFGIGPAILWMAFRSNPRRILSPASPAWLRVSIIYGLMAFFVAPFVSFWLERDFGYAWPAFWIAAPVLLQSYAALSSTLVCVLLAENFAAAWLPYWLSVAREGSLAPVALGVALLIQLAACLTLRTRVVSLAHLKESVDGLGRAAANRGSAG